MSVISRLIEQNIEINYNFNKAKISNNSVEEVLALLYIIKLINYNMRVNHRKFYRKIEPTYQDSFSFNSIFYSN